MEHGGRVAANGKDGESAARLGITEYGARVDVWDKDGKSKATLHGGGVNVWDKDRKLGAHLGIGKYGGHIAAPWQRREIEGVARYQ